MAALAAQDVTFAYLPAVPIVRRWHATFPAGSVTALTGPSGSGKSTVLYLLGLMLRPNGGQVLLNGDPVHAVPDAVRGRLRAHWFGFVFQDAALDAFRTVLDNVVETALYRGQPRRQVVARAHTLLEQFGVGLRADHKPGQVSGGQAQRIALCRALLGAPPVVLADEPTGNLDAVTGDVVISALRAHSAGGACVVIATHDPTVIAACDRQISLEASS